MIKFIFLLPLFLLFSNVFSWATPDSAYEASFSEARRRDSRIFLEGLGALDSDQAVNSLQSSEESPSQVYNESHTLKPGFKSSDSSSFGESKIAKDDDFVIPDWLKRTSYGVIITSDEKPNLYLETVQPLYQSMDKTDTFFTHDRISCQNFDTAYSVGLGYRRLLFNDSLLAGINAFIDYQDFRKRLRQGLGIEALTNTLEFRANSYFGLSGKRIIDESITTTTYERVVNGGDVEIGCPVPFLPWFKIFGGFYLFDFKKSKNMDGWKMRGEIKPLRFVTLNLETFGDSKSGQQYRSDIRFNLNFGDFGNLFSLFKPQQSAFPNFDLSSRTLDRVERNFNIQVEQWGDSKSGNGGVGNLSNVQLVVRFPGVNPVTVDTNGNGFVDANEAFEIDVLMTNNSGVNSTGIAYNNAVVSNGWLFNFNNSAVLPDAPSGGTTRTNDATDMDLTLPDPPLAPPGLQFNITLDFTADGQTKTLTFGPFTVGSIYNNQVINQI
jgi:hypothetical protein